MVEIRFDKNFKKYFSKIKDKSLKIKIQKQVKKISGFSEIGKLMRDTRKGTRELYVKPFRLSYMYFKNKDMVYILDLYYKKHQ